MDKDKEVNNDNSEQDHDEYVDPNYLSVLQYYEDMSGEGE